MKRLIFVRHGKAEDQSPELIDFERSLTTKGKIISKKMAARLKEKNQSPGILITSPAFRALETALIFAGVFRTDPREIIMSSEIYYKMNLQSLHTLLSLVDEETDTVTFFGHNPSFTEIPDSLSREGFNVMPKSGIACLSFKISTWSEIRRNSGNLEFFLKPEK